MSLPFLFEIGVEEIPDWMIPDALENLRVLFEKLEIPHESVTLDATPRRLVLRAEGLPARQADSQERVLGPAKSAPAQAVEGFARKQGVKPEDLTVETTPKGEYYSFIRKVPGRPTKDILAEALPGIILRDLLPQDDVLDRQGRPALHPAHPLDRGAAGRRDRAVRAGRRALRRAHFRPPPAGRARDRRHAPPITSSACAIITSSSRPKSGATGSAKASPASA